MTIVPIAVIALMAAGTTVVAANPGHFRHAVRPVSAASVADPTTPPVVDPTTPPLVDPTTPPVVISPVVAGAQAPVNLGAAGSFAVLAKSGITNVYASTITGNVGASPITGAAIDLTCPEVTGTIFTVDAAGPLPCAVVDATGLTAAVGDEETAYTDAAGRTNPDVVNLGAGEIGGLTLTPGLYKWGTDVSISNDLTLTGGPNDVWIFQIAGRLNEASAKNVTLAGGAQAKNVFWQVAGAATIGTTAHFEGTLLSQTMIALNTGASTNGRLLAQTAVTLQMNTVTLPDMSVVTPPVVETTPPVVETTPPVVETTPPVVETTPPTVTDPPTATVTDPPTATVTDPPTATVTDPPTATVTDPPTVP
jgi:Ice-binding-like